MKEKIIQNYMYSLIYQVLTVIVPLATTPYISRVMTSNEVGLYDYSLTLCTYFMFLASAGVPILAQREVVLNQKELSKCFSYYCTLRFFLAIIVCVVYCVISVLLFDNKILYLLQGIGILASGFDISWYYAGRENFKIITNRNIAFKILSVLLLFIFVKGKYALLFYVLSITLPNLIGNLLMFWKLDVDIIWMRVELKAVINTLKKSIALLIPSLVLQLYAIVDKTILGCFSTMSELGYYAQSLKIVNLLAVASTTLGTVVFPQIVRLYNEDEKKMCELVSRVLDVIIHLFFLPIFGIAACADIFSEWFYGSNYVGIDWLLILSMPIVIFKALSYVTANQVMIATNREKDLIKLICGGTVLNCFLDVLLAAPFGAKGTIVATIVSEFLVLVFSIMSFEKKHGEIKLINLNNIRAAVAAVIEYGVLVCLKQFLPIENEVIKTFILGMIGFAIYVLLLKFLKDWYCSKAENLCANYMRRKIR